MAIPIRTKRIIRERVNLEKSNDDYFVRFNDDNLFTFFAYVIGPADTLYGHKFVKLRFDIPERYPLEPPKVKFIQHTGGRIHPNLYVEGKVCLSILGTWPGEKWAYAMTIETVLITVRSLLDDAPYKHEPNQRDNPNFNQYVQYTTWKSLLLDYVNNESDMPYKQFLEQHIIKHGAKMIEELQRQATSNSAISRMSSPYGQPTNVNYTDLMQKITKMIDQCQTNVAGRQAAADPLVAPCEETNLGASKAPNLSSMEPSNPSIQTSSSSLLYPHPNNDQAMLSAKGKHEVIEID